MHSCVEARKAHGQTTFDYVIVFSKCPGFVDLCHIWSITHSISLIWNSKLSTFIKSTFMFIVLKIYYTPTNKVLGSIIGITLSVLMSIFPACLTFPKHMNWCWWKLTPLVQMDNLWVCLKEDNPSWKYIKRVIIFAVGYRSSWFDSVCNFNKLALWHYFLQFDIIAHIVSSSDLWPTFDIKWQG